MSNADESHCIVPFTKLADILLQVKPVAYDKHIDSRPGKNGSHQPANLNGHRAVFMLHVPDLDTWIGEGWVGVSGKTAPHVPKDSNIKLLRAGDDGTVDVGEIIGCKEPLQITHKFGRIYNHGKCSEVALINGLFHYLVAKKQYELVRDTQNSCELYLLTERLPCCSCTNLMYDFLQEFPKVNLHVGYMFDITQERQEIDARKFLSRIKNRAYAYKVQIISSNDVGHVAASGKTQWRPSGFNVTSSFSAVPKNSVEYVLNIVRVSNEGERVVPAKNPLSRGPGEASANFNALINSGKMRIPEKSSNLAYFFSALFLVGVAWAVTSRIDARRNRL